MSFASSAFPGADAILVYAKLVTMHCAKGGLLLYSIAIVLLSGCHSAPKASSSASDRLRPLNVL
ncbi:MAG TPA: hypothetical protein DEQ47_19265, partial [Solibacterales bacterium]|nr:hypothetical protein [Bryobacterales bacterium]